MQVKVAFTETHQLEAGKDVGGHLPKPKGEQMIDADNYNGNIIETTGECNIYEGNHENIKIG